MKVAVNISTRQFNDPGGFADEVTRMLNATDWIRVTSMLEMTESILLKNAEREHRGAARLGELGRPSGGGRLRYRLLVARRTCKQLPLDTLKIDRTFVRDIETDSDDAAIIGAIIAMAHGLDVRVTAEGVETKGQMEALRKLGCDEFQGYLLSKPLPAGEFRRAIPRAGNEESPQGYR